MNIPDYLQTALPPHREHPRDIRVMVGMSGGVDSSVAAWLLCEAGYQVEGLFMFNWDAEDVYCTAAQDYQDARRVCEELDIPLHRADFSRQYRDRVFSHFLAEYRAGRTPNPDILCNREIKFDVFLAYARQLGADYIATGHYARLRHTDNGRVSLLKAVDENKDQTYFLHAVPPEALARTIFPLGGLAKQRVRELAVSAGFHNHDKKDSTGICFIGERDFGEFLARYVSREPGPMLTPEGEQVGQHTGLSFYTLGQRQGLGIGGRAGADERPWYVLDKDTRRNVLIVGQGHDHPWLLHRRLECGAVHWISGETPSLPLRCNARVRYRQREQACTVSALNSGDYEVCFEREQWAVTPGQSVVFYAGDECLGGGVIRERGEVRAIHTASGESRA